MNNTKWEELRLAMYRILPEPPQWRTKNIENDYVSDWDGEWYYHFQTGGYKTIKWVEIKVNSEEQRNKVLQSLKKSKCPSETNQ